MSLLRLHLYGVQVNQYDSKEYQDRSFESSLQLYTFKVVFYVIIPQKSPSSQIALPAAAENSPKFRLPSYSFLENKKSFLQSCSCIQRTSLIILDSPEDKIPGNADVPSSRRLGIALTAILPKEEIRDDAMLPPELLCRALIWTKPLSIAGLMTTGADRVVERMEAVVKSWTVIDRETMICVAAENIR